MSWQSRGSYVQRLSLIVSGGQRKCEPRHDKTKDPMFLHADSEDSDQTGRMPRLIRGFAGRTVTLLYLSCRGSNVNQSTQAIERLG